MTELSEGAGGCNTLLVLVDRLTKFCRLLPCVMGDTHPLTTAEVARILLREIVCRFGVPSSLVCDRDPRFTAGLWQDLWT